MGFETIIYEKRAPIAFVTLNRPEKLNALSQQLQAEVREALEDAGWADDAIRVIVLKANGRAFSAGFDLSGGGGPSNAHTIRRSFMQGKGFSASAWWEVFWGNPKPIIAQVHGFCIAGGCATASFCDLRVASEDALFGAPEIRTGGPYVPAIWPWLVGAGKARELLYTGNLIDAQEAHRLGMVNHVVPREQLDQAVQKLALTISKVLNMAYEQVGMRQVIERSLELEANAMASPGSSPEIAEYNRLVSEQGLNAALSWNAARFAEEDAWFRAARKRT
ncbi:MAG: enoyl-CoA hydratase/isomerase family protein [Dehalococcoidia bacterium]|nr:enoyl-CoA hydratase/isomerase family protein [Dehalococcoidia bacterium]